MPESAKLAKALDAVRGPNGTIVCRSTLTNPNDGCSPYNAMGTGVNTSAAAAYFMGTDWVRQTIHQDGVAGTLRGEPFSTWAGPISIATGVEYRRDTALGTANPIGLVDGFGNANYKPIAGSVHVTEGFAEVVVPLIKGGIFKSLDFNGAIRGTDYSFVRVRHHLEDRRDVRADRRREAPVHAVAGYSRGKPVRALCRRFDRFGRRFRPVPRRSDLYGPADHHG